LRFKKSAKETFKKEINESVDPSMADALIKLIESKKEYTKKEFEDLVCCNEDLWEMLRLGDCTKVNVLQEERLERELPVEESEDLG
jgi:hypothetical protein